MTLVTDAINHIGLAALGRKVNKWPSAVQRWRDLNRLPQTDLLGITDYAHLIEEVSGGKYLAADLLECSRAQWRSDVARRAAIAKSKRAIP